MCGQHLTTRLNRVGSLDCSFVRTVTDVFLMDNTGNDNPINNNACDSIPLKSMICLRSSMIGMDTYAVVDCSSQIYWIQRLIPINIDRYI